MKITILGAGYVGLVTGVCLSDFGFEVVCIDKRQDAIASLQQGQTPFFEPGLDALIERNVGENRLSFSTDADPAIAEADLVFIAVGTPTREGGREANLDYVYAAAEQIALGAKDGAIIVVKSTVPVGTNAEVKRIVEAKRPGAGISVVSNPEFLREGSAIEDFMRPDRVVVGVDNPEAEAVMRRLYRPLSLRESPLLVTDHATAELIKYAANAFLATKISFINEVADLSEKVGANVQEVAKGIGLDGRIGSKFLHPGPGFGGSCFPKDTRALAEIGRKVGSVQQLVETVIAVNESRKEAMVERIQAAVGELKGKRLAVLGLAFKPNTDDMRESPSLTIVPQLVQAGAEVVAFDPEGMDNAKGLLPGAVVYAASTYEAVEGADAIIIITEWNEFRALNLNRLGELAARKLIIDLRNIFPLEEMAEAGFEYHSIGRATVRA